MVPSSFQTGFQRRWETHPVATSAAVGFGAWALSVLLYFSWVLMLPENRYRWLDFVVQCRDPFCRTLNETILYYRLAVPAFAYLLHIPPHAAFAIQYVALIWTLALAFWLVAKKTAPATGLWFALGLALTYMVACVNARPGLPDSVTHLAAAFCMAPIAPGAYVPLVFIGALNDERMLLALPFVLFWKFPDLLENKAAFGQAFRHGVWLLAGVAVWLVFRHLLTVGILGPGIETPAIYRGFRGTLTDFTPYFSTWPKWWWNVFTSYRWMWIPWLLALAAMKTTWRTKLAFAAAGAAVVAASMIVADVSRSIGFAYGMLMAAVLMLSRTWAPGALNRLLMVVVALQVFTPMGIFMSGEKIVWLSPPLYKLAREWLAGP